MHRQRKRSLPGFNPATERTKLVKSVKHSSNLSEKLFSLFKKREFSDICVIASDGVQFHAHKIVLSVGSDFFNSMFGSTLKESKDKEVMIREVNGGTLEPILKFMYTGNIELHNDVVEDILRAANFFQIKPLIVECYNFMGEELDDKNCLGIIFFAEQHDLKQLYEKATKFACEHFEQVSNEEEFLKLNEDQVSKIICSEYLYAGMEESVFMSLINWIEYDKKNREKSAFKLFSHIRYWLLNSEFIKKHRNNLPKQVKYVEMICTWLEWHLSPDTSKLSLNETTKSTISNEKLVFFARGNKQTYNPELNTWTCENLNGFPSNFDKIVKINNNKIIIKSGQNLKCFDLETNEISDLPHLDTPRKQFGLILLTNELYVVGGRQHDNIRVSWQRLVDKFNFTSNKWQSVAPMTRRLTEPQVTSAGGILYVKGNEQTIECFNPATNEWTSIKSQISNMSKFGFTNINRKLFIIGGKREEFWLNSLDIFDPLSNQWVTTFMRIGLSSPKCTSWHNRLIVCGGYDDTNTLLNLVQEYNPLTKKWRVLASVDQINDDNYDIINI